MTSWIILLLGIGDELKEFFPLLQTIAIISINITIIQQSISVTILIPYYKYLRRY